MTAFAEIHRRIVRPDGVRRLGQALWMMVGEPVRVADLVWARGMFGERGDALLWQALSERGALREHDARLRAWMLASFLSVLWDNSPDAQTESRLVWTLPPQLAVPGVEGDSYVTGAVQMIQSALQCLTIVAPYLERRGMGSLHGELINAVSRNVSVRILTHGIENLASLNSTALEHLRRDCAGLRGTLTVWTATPTAGVLLHLKAVVADARCALIGSANMTANAFAMNVEAGVVLGPREATEITRVVDRIISSDLSTIARSGPC